MSARFHGTDSYVATEDLMMAVNAAVTLGRPLLVKGEPGTGKTQLAEEIAGALQRPLYRWHIKSTTKAQQGLYDYDAVSRLRDSQLGEEKVHDVANYIIKGRMWEAFESEVQPVLLVDEIDKAEPEFEAFLLEVLSDFQVSVPELGTIKATNIPLVVLTSNNARELSDGLKRRCLHLFIDFPPPDEELAIIRLKVPELPERLAQAVVGVVNKIRGLELRKAPSVSESLDWARSLVILNADSLDRELVESTLTMLVKHEKDLERVRGALDKVLAEAPAK
jgi:MoxR-like ATPase